MVVNLKNDLILTYVETIIEECKEQKFILLRILQMERNMLALQQVKI